jgi:hypothetical protein
LAAVGRTLRAMLDEAGIDRAAADPIGVWEVFKTFAAMPVVAERAERIDSPEGDLLLAEWDATVADEALEARLTLDLVRQFTIVDGGGYVRMEQLRCSMAANVLRSRDVGAGAIWSADGRDEWTRDVDRSAVVRALAAGETRARVTVTLEHV